MAIESVGFVCCCGFCYYSLFLCAFSTAKIERSLIRSTATTAHKKRKKVYISSNQYEETPQINSKSTQSASGWLDSAERAIAESINSGQRFLDGLFCNEKRAACTPCVQGQFRRRSFAQESDWKNRCARIVLVIALTTERCEAGALRI